MANSKMAPLPQGLCFGVGPLILYIHSTHIYEVLHMCPGTVLIAVNRSSGDTDTFILIQLHYNISKQANIEANTRKKVQFSKRFRGCECWVMEVKGAFFFFLRK